ncbi:hypothetical protein D3C72_943870 [compost metagenome]
MYNTLSENTVLAGLLINMKGIGVSAYFCIHVHFFLCVAEFLFELISYFKHSLTGLVYNNNLNIDFLYLKSNYHCIILQEFFSTTQPGVGALFLCPINIKTKRIMNTVHTSARNNTIGMNIMDTGIYQELMAKVISEFSNDMLSYSQMLAIAEQEIQLLLIAVAKNGNKINISQLAPRNIRLAILNRLNKIAA